MVLKKVKTTEKHTGRLIRKSSKLKRCFLPLKLKLLRSQIEIKNFGYLEFLCLPV